MIGNLNNFLQILFSPTRRSFVERIGDDWTIKKQEVNQVWKVSVNFDELENFENLGFRQSINVVDHNKNRALYFCHGFCELGAYPVVPALQGIRDFMVTNPGEVVIIVVEDYVTPQDLAVGVYAVAAASG